MKSILILILFIPLVGWGQYPVFYNPVYAPQPKQDTIKCLMLVCDTARGGGWVDSAIYNGKLIEVGRHEGRYSYNVWWQFGYEVRKGWNVYRINQDRSKTPMFHVEEYLDQNKKALPKSIVVWQSKELTPHHK